MRASERKTKQEDFLTAFANCCSVRAACIMAGISRSVVYHWQETDEVFAERFKQATEDANDMIEDEIVRRAVHGYDEPVVSMGKVVYGSDGQPLMMKKYSDPLLSMLAKSRMPKYRDKQQVEHSGSIDVSGAKELLMQRLERMREVKSDE